jgi:hypothetical protein
MALSIGGIMSTNDITGDAIISKANSQTFRDNFDNIFRSDANVEAVREKLRSRAALGLQKYGVTTERDDLSMLQWLIHAQEEALDLAVYLQRLINDISKDKK